MLRWKDKKLSGLDHERLLRNSGTYVVLGLALVAMTFFGVCSPRENGVLPSGAAAKVAGEKITPMEFNRAYRNTYQRMQSQFAEGFDPASMGLSRMVLRQLIDERIAYKAALDAGLEATEDDVMKVLVDAKAFQDENGKFSGDAYNNYLRSNGYTEASFTEELRRSLTVQKFRQLITATAYQPKAAAKYDYMINETKVELDYLKFDPSMAKVEVSQDDITKFLTDAGKARVKEYYDQNKTEFTQEPQMKARHILISYTGARNASAEGALRGKEDAKKRAAEILAKVKAPGADFVKLAKESTDEPAGKNSGGDLGFFTKEAMVKEFSDAAFAMKPGQISEIVESPFGFHIIKIEDMKTAKNVNLEEATNSIAHKLLEKERAPKILQEKAEEALAELKAGKTPAVMQAWGIKWASTTPFTYGARYIEGIGSDEAVASAATALKGPGSLYDKVLDVRGSKFILRLKSRTEADLSKLDDKKTKEMADSAAMSQGYAMYSAFEKNARKELESKGRIWENPEYLSLDQRQSRNEVPTEEDTSGG